MAQLKSGTRIYGTATIDTSVVVGSAVTLSSSGIQVSGISTLGVTSTTNLTSQQLNVSGISTLGVTSTTNLTSQQLNVSGVTTFTNGPVLIGGGTSTGTAGQVLQVTGINSSVYIGGSIGIGTTNPAEKLQVQGNVKVTSSTSATQDGIILSGRAGGTGSFAVTLTPTTLASSTTLTLPNVTDTVATVGTTQTFTAAQTFRAANAVRSEAASTQDAVVLAGRAGGTGSFAVTLTPTTLSASRTLTLPDTAGTVITTGDSATVTNTMLSTVSTSTIRGRVTAGTGAVENLTGTQATTLLDTFTSALKGLAPASGGGTSNFLRADGTWAAAGGSTISNSPSGTVYPTLSSATSGSFTTAYTSSSSLTFTSSTGNLSATQFTSLSDVNRKINIRPIENAIDITKKLEGVRFDWKDTNSPSIGVIAQEVEKVLPELVVDTDGVKSVSYGNIVGVLIEAIKEQQVRIEELERKLNA